MKKVILIIAALFTLAASTFARPVTTADALSVANRFWTKYHPSGVKTIVSPKVLTFAGLDQLHIFDMEGQGFIIVAADDRVKPVLAYSFENPFPSELNPELAYWLRGYNAQIAEMVKGGDFTQSADILQQWSELSPLTDTDGDIDSTAASDTTSTIIRIPAMVQTQWDQGAPYNMYCPYDSARHGRTVVGCVATAMAQIMKYWNHPAYGEGFHSYQPSSMWHPGISSPTLSVDFGQTTYLWENMPNRLELFSQAHEKEAVALLSYHCGVAVEMMYGVSADGGSGAYSSCGSWVSACATNAFHLYFRYDSSLFYSYRNHYSDDDWTALIDENLALGQPMYYSGSDSTGGHAFVLDGADNQQRYHFNWGWSGYGDGFYTVNNLAPGSGGDGGNATYTFNSSQGAIFGIKPVDEEINYDTIEYYDTICNTSQYYYFHEHRLAVTDTDTLLRHLNSYYHYHLRVINQQRLFLNPNISGRTPLMKYFCPAEGYTLPDCTFTNQGHMFIGWCRSKTGDDTIYQPGQHANLKSSATFFAMWVDTTTASILDLEGENISLWPNPTSGELFISLSLGHDAQLFVIDALGRTVLREKHPNAMGGTAKITLQDLPAGLYTIQIKTAGGIYNQRIIKQ